MVRHLVLVPLVDALLVQVQRLSSWRDVEDDEEDEAERDEDGYRHANLVELLIAIPPLFLHVCLDLEWVLIEDIPRADFQTSHFLKPL